VKIFFCILSLFSACLCVTAQAPPASDRSAASSEWRTGQPEVERISADPLKKMEDAIQSGDLKKITSVLIARHGKLVYENYFNGSNADILQDTRSATKSHYRHADWDCD
jgi:hypothetical protein